MSNTATAICCVATVQKLFFIKGLLFNIITKCATLQQQFAMLQLYRSYLAIQINFCSIYICKNVQQCNSKFLWYNYKVHSYLKICSIPIISTKNVLHCNSNLLHCNCTEIIYIKGFLFNIKF